jgi:hypothetical protein
MRVALHALALLLVGAAAVTSCKDAASEFCDEYCDCENCSDRERERCVVDTEEQIDVASAYDCDDERDLVDECILAKFDCKENHFEYPKGTECGKEYDALTKCIDRGSDCQGEGCPG